jgi:GTP:adenosylcobinamide-phosphate guanylyltransferase
LEYRGHDRFDHAAACRRGHGFKAGITRVLNAVVLAGGPPDAVSRLQPGAANKAFVEIGGKALVTRTLEALRSAPSVGSLIVVAPPETYGSPALRLADAMRPAGIHIRDSLASGLEQLPADEAVLISASDLPILSVACIEEFISGAQRTTADLAYAILERNIHDARFSEVPHTWARMREGTYCGGGFVALKPRIYPTLARVIERLGAARKNPMRLASLFGFGVLVKFALRRLSVADAEARASHVLHARVRAVPSTFPEMAVNVDRASDVALAERLVKAALPSTA